ncbi:uncharacterized protein LOC111022694 [Momordica charantia]|uniref:Uncharacterized protein LOC111022694 n=1 Tax=Momordica charantia TaxID=3673 RepID=A0A6J1DPW2_MOMCH|nr:uncharacterized protein LOC111022694 [Momordica charantia]
MQDSYYHEHPLILLPTIGFNGTICNSCKNDCREFVYRCPPCNFNLHVACLKSFNHEHSFTKFWSPAEFVCRACGEKGDEFSWFCVTCHLPVHKKCAELPLTLRIYGHRRHDLRLTYFRHGAEFVPNKIDCKFCCEEIKTQYAGYGCYECNYFVHLNCASSQSMPIDAIDSSDDDDDDQITEISGTEIQHFIHPHGLKFFPPKEVGQDRVCNGCMKGLLSTPPSNTYGCKQCDFIVHKQCLELPLKKRNFLHKHKLTLISIPDFVFQCEACRQHFHGFAYHCRACFSTFDTRCASIKIPFEHPGHEHPLSLNRTNEDHNCEGCGEGVKKKLAFRCVHCDFHLDARCATLPATVRHRADAHPLELGFVEEEGEEYYCDVCELEREPQVWFYGCRECSFSAHLECVVGEFPHVKSKMHEAHRHPLNLAMKWKGVEQGGDCAACGESCSDDLAFECGVCKFNVHAVGHCYHRGTVQGKLASTNRCFYYRGIGLHQHPIQNGWTRGKLGPYGGRGGSPWEEKVFASIRGFAVYHEGWVDAFQILHESNNGGLIWSRNHGGNGGSRSEVVFDYPDEYLVSIRGHYSDLRKWGSELVVIRSLTLETNRRSCGPYGEEDGTKFSFPAGTKFIGLHGRSGQFLDAIGPYTISKQ